MKKLLKILLIILAIILIIYIGAAVFGYLPQLTAWVAEFSPFLAKIGSWVGTFVSENPWWATALLAGGAAIAIDPDAAEAVTDIVENIGDGVGTIIGGVVDTVGDTVGAIADPLVPWLLGGLAFWFLWPSDDRDDRVVAAGAAPYVPTSTGAPL